MTTANRVALLFMSPRVFFRFHIRCFVSKVNIDSLTVFIAIVLPGTERVDPLH